MTIALIAHDAKKELMVQFCIAYCGILSKHNLCATSITAKYITQQIICATVEIGVARPILKSVVFSRFAIIKDAGTRTTRAPISP